MEFKHLVKTGYNKIAEEYLASRTRNSEDIRLLDDLIYRLPRNAIVLDAGCGAGIPVTRILSERFEVTGVDFSEAQIELAKKNIPQASFICRDMTRLDETDGTFDAICCYYAIIHIPREEHQPVLLNFYRMLKPGGLGLFCLGAENLVGDIDENYFGTPMYWSHFDADTYLQILKEIGFFLLWSKIVADETCEGSGHLFALVQKGA
ncbi:MAG: class I SAM-dependent methyltransferase [Bacteroidota bacterium]